jgi:acyl carrier protein
VVIVDRDTATSPDLLRRSLTESRATVLQATPTTWRMLIEHGWPGDPRLTALCGGEAMPRELARELGARCATLWNMYGPTETTVWSAASNVEPGEGSVPVAGPIDNTMLYVLDAHRRLQPTGVPGELWIGGDGLARGYLGRDELTRERFVEDPFRGLAGARMYRTGDLVRRTNDGTLEFLGRTDDQVKIRGYRIELGEIEAVIAEHPRVAEVVVAAREFATGDVRLVGYVIERTTQSPVDPATPPIDVEELRHLVRSRLPDYMVPSAIMVVDAFPLTPNKKVDRGRLPLPTLVATSRAEHRPLPGTEAVLAEIWEDVLGVDNVHRHDDFFELGGHSLLAVRIFARMQRDLGVQLPMTTLFSARTLVQLAAAIDSTTPRPFTSLIPLRPVANGVAPPPMFYVAPFHGEGLRFSATAPVSR